MNAWDGRRSLFLEVFTGRLKYFVYLSLILILISVVIDFQFESSHAELDLATRVAEMKLPFWDRAPFYAALFRDLGFAVLIAFVISLLVDQAAHMEQNSFFETAVNQIRSEHAQIIEKFRSDHVSFVDQISKNVFLSVLKKKLPDEISNIAIDILVGQQYIRKDLYLKYTIDMLEEPGFQESHRYVSVKGHLSYRYVNITEGEVRVNINLFLPMPADPAIRHRLTIDRVMLGERELSRSEIQEGDSRISDSETDKRATWPVTLGVGQTLAVGLDYSLVKEVSDSDCWTSLAPTSGGQYEVRVNVGNLEGGGDALHSGSLIPADGSPTGIRLGGGCLFNFERALLPFQGVLLWWRPRRDTVGGVIANSSGAQFEAGT